MGIPQVPEQVRRAPTLALRAVFAGIGRILMSADRPDALITATQYGAGTDIEHRQWPVRRGQQPASIPPAQPSSRWRSLDQTGNVRLLSAEDLDDDDFLPPVIRVEAAEAALATADADRPAAAVPAVTAPSPALPIAGYDSLSLASIRARLRGLDVAQLRVLLDYEVTNAERPEILGMFERRIEKLESAG